MYLSVGVTFFYMVLALMALTFKGPLHGTG